MGKTYKDNPNKWRKHSGKQGKPWKKQKGNKPTDDKAPLATDDGLDAQGSPR